MPNVTILVPKKHHVKFIGVGNKTKQQFRSIGCTVNVPRKEEDSREISFEFDQSKGQQVQNAIVQVLGHPIQQGPMIIMEVDIPSTKFGKVIGSRASVLKRMEVNCFCGLVVPKRGQGGRIKIEVHQQNAQKIIDELQVAVNQTVTHNILQTLNAGQGGSSSSGGGGGNMPTVGMRVEAKTDQGIQAGVVTQPPNTANKTVKVRFDCNGQEFDVPVNILRAAPNQGASSNAQASTPSGLEMGARVAATSNQAGLQLGTIVGPQAGNVIKVRMDMDGKEYDIPLNILQPAPKNSCRVTNTSFTPENQHATKQQFLNVKQYFCHMIQQGAQQRGVAVPEHWVKSKAGDLAKTLKKKGGRKQQFWTNSQKWFEKQLKTVIQQAQQKTQVSFGGSTVLGSQRRSNVGLSFGGGGGGGGFGGGNLKAGSRVTAQMPNGNWCPGVIKYKNAGGSYRVKWPSYNNQEASLQAHQIRPR